MSCATVETVTFPRQRSGRPVTARHVPVRRVAGGTSQGPAGGALRLTRRGRAVLALLAVVVAGGTVLGAQSASADAPGEPVQVVRHTVDRGDTLWQLAASVAAPGEDVRDVVVELQELNGLAGQDLRVGQEVLLPAR